MAKINKEGDIEKKVEDILNLFQSLPYGEKVRLSGKLLDLVTPDKGGSREAEVKL